mmetsp:Transcript_6133/g.17119  ORF Transcript_6133/g.17119 Transcript_6133/m.17119 type:complete len:205 (-) Transcript_6133:1833-2447(-)
MSWAPSPPLSVSTTAPTWRSGSGRSTCGSLPRATTSCTLRRSSSTSSTWCRTSAPTGRLPPWRACRCRSATRSSPLYTCATWRPPRCCGPAVPNSTTPCLPVPGSRFSPARVPSSSSTPMSTASTSLLLARLSRALVMWDAVVAPAPALPGSSPLPRATATLSLLLATPETWLQEGMCRGQQRARWRGAPLSPPLPRRATSTGP